VRVIDRNFSSIPTFGADEHEWKTYQWQGPDTPEAGRVGTSKCGGSHHRIYAGAASNRGRSASHEVEDDGNHSQYQQNVNKECGDMEYEKASQPQQQQNESKN
jgi:hypothetical protein